MPAIGLRHWLVCISVMILVEAKSTQWFVIFSPPFYHGTPLLFQM